MVLKLGEKGALVLDHQGTIQHVRGFRVKVVDDALEGAFNSAKSKFEHYHYEVFAAPKTESNSLSEEKIQFQTDIDGEIDSVAIQFEPATKPLVKVPPPPTIAVRTADPTVKALDSLKSWVGELSEQIGVQAAAQTKRGHSDGVAATIAQLGGQPLW